MSKNDESVTDPARIAHAAMELLGAIDEYKFLPCKSLEERLHKTADRYRLRIAEAFNRDTVGNRAFVPTPAEPPAFPADGSVLAIRFEIGVSQADVLIPTQSIRQADHAHAMVSQRVADTVMQMVNAAFETGKS